MSFWQIYGHEVKDQHPLMDCFQLSYVDINCYFQVTEVFRLKRVWSLRFQWWVILKTSIFIWSPGSTNIFEQSLSQLQVRHKLLFWIPSFSSNIHTSHKEIFFTKIQVKVNLTIKILESLSWDLVEVYKRKFKKSWGLNVTGAPPEKIVRVQQASEYSPAFTMRSSMYD